MRALNVAHFSHLLAIGIFLQMGSPSIASRQQLPLSQGNRGSSSSAKQQKGDLHSRTPMRSLEHGRLSVKQPARRMVVTKSGATYSSATKHRTTSAQSYVGGPSLWTTRLPRQTTFLSSTVPLTTSTMTGPSTRLVRTMSASTQISSSAAPISSTASSGATSTATSPASATASTTLSSTSSPTTSTMTSTATAPPTTPTATSSTGTTTSSTTPTATTTVASCSTEASTSSTTSTTDSTTISTSSSTEQTTSSTTGSSAVPCPEGTGLGTHDATCYKITTDPAACCAAGLSCYMGSFCSYL